MQLASNRKGYIGGKYERNGANLNKEASGSALINNGGKHRNVALSMAARKKELIAQAELSAQVIEKNKKKVLDALNKNYRKKY